MPDPKVYVEYIAKVDGLAKASTEIQATSGKVGAIAKKGFVPAVAALGALAVASSKAVEAASGLNEQMNASQVTFGQHATAVQDWSKTSATAFGLSQREALAAANGFGNMLSTAGMTEDQMASMSTALTGLAGDMGSFFDQDPSEMLEKLRSGLAGEAEPLRKFGVDLSAAHVQQVAYQKGLAKTGETLTEGQKVQARYAIIMEQTQKAHGDFARTADGVANSQRIVAAQTEDASAAFGKALLPAMQMLLGVATQVLAFLTRYPTVTKVLVVAILALAAAIVAYNVAMAVAAIVSLPMIGTIGLIVLAVAALIAVAVLLWKNWGTITAAIAAGWQWLSGLAVSVKTAIVGAFTSLVATITGLVRSFLSWLRANWQTILAILAGPIGLAVLLLARYWSQITAGARSAIDAVKRAWNDLKSWIGGVVGSIVSTLGKVTSKLDGIGDAASSAVGTVKSAIDGLVSWLEHKVGKVTSAATGIANAIKGPINAVIGAWNGIVFHVPKITIGGGSVAGVDLPKASFGGQSIGFPDIPKLARGAVVDSPTLALVGEGSGRELVTPEDLLREIVSEHGGSYTLILQPRTADAADVAYGFRRLELLRTGR